jgi:FMN-dependent NADH-azoreductase
MKTLVVKYLPSGERSNTKKLLDSTLSKLNSNQVETLDLLKEKIPFFDEASLGAYGKRNYMKQELKPEEKKLLAAQDRLVAQFKAADRIIMAYPMHNFGMPGLVKLYFDAIMLNGETFEMGKKLMAGKKALTLFTAGGVYPSHQASIDYPHWDTLTMNAKINFIFMGFDQAEVVGTSLRDPDCFEKNFSEADQKISAVLKNW